jgi:hypothetical protein
MTKFTLIASFTIAILLSSCDNTQKRNLQEGLQQMNNNLNLPSPTWDKDLEELRKEYKEKYGAEVVRFTRPFFYTSEEDHSYWLKVELLNPEIENQPFKEFGKEVSLATFDHLINDHDFEKIEISVVRKKGFIVNFSSSQNAYYYRDSLQVTSK